MSDRLRAGAIAFAIAGLAIAAYLTYVHYENLRPLCLAGGGCETVQASQWSKLAGIPVAVLGLGGYAAILASLFARGEAARLATVALTLPGWLFSAYLTYRELFTIHAICQWCVASALVMTALAVIAVARYLRG